jgi:hypothetical protein
MHRALTFTTFTNLGTSLAAALLLAACTPKDGPAAETPPPLQATQVAASGDPDQIALSGHGALFDADMRRIVLTQQALIAMQDTLTKRLQTTDSRIDPKILKRLANRNIGPAERFWLSGARISNLLERRDDAESKRLLRINDNILQQSWRFKELQLPQRLQATVQEWLGRLTRPVSSTDYINRCRAAGVPIPPDFATTSPQWQNQGSLTTNLLGPGEFAGVYTFHDPHVRGACVALPRESGSAGSPSGIICQSATTGAACFWDNKLRSGGPTAPFMGWRNLTLRIADLQNGDNLSDNCTRCHSGNNVYLVTPDDPTWGRLLRRTMAGPDYGNFTLRVRNSTDTTSPAGSGGPFRYVPISSQGWVNQGKAPGCATGCHEGTTNDLELRYYAHTPAPPAMAPLCSKRPGTPDDVERCYVNPF